MITGPGSPLMDLAVYFADPARAPLGLAAAFVVGICVGSFLNVCSYRLPLEKSVLWPRVSHCGHCFQPIAWYDNMPLLSYLWLRGRCRVCGARFSVRYFLIELLTGLGLAGLFYLEVTRDLHRFDQILSAERSAVARLCVFGFHGTLYCFLLVASMTDLDHQHIPLGLTAAGALIGLAGSMLFAWPWPYSAKEALPGIERGVEEVAWALGAIRIREAVYPWPVWGPLPWPLRGHAGTWYEGLATGFAGLLAGTLVLRGTRFAFGLFRPEYTEDADPEAQTRWIGRRVLSWFGRVGGKALGIGDADLMMMAGSFIGWQPVLVAYFLGVFFALAHGICHLVVRGNVPFAFGPGLACGVLTVTLGWQWLGPGVQWLFFGKIILFALALVYGGVLLWGFLIWLKRLAAAVFAG